MLAWVIYVAAFLAGIGAFLIAGQQVIQGRKQGTDAAATWSVAILLSTIGLLAVTISLAMMTGNYFTQ